MPSARRDEINAGTLCQQLELLYRHRIILPPGAPTYAALEKVNRSSGALARSRFLGMPKAELVSYCRRLVANETFWRILPSRVGPQAKTQLRAAMRSALGPAV